MTDIRWSKDGTRVELLSPISMPRASAFLWSKKMLVQVNCRGYATAQFMQPEPAKYAHAPNLEAKTFMQPEQPYYAHHPGRFFYVKDEETGALFSAPYEPVRASLDQFLFSVGKSDILWEVEQNGVQLRITLSLAPEDPVELWHIEVINASQRERKLSFYPYFPIGYMSWMNQSAQYRADLNGIVASSVTPYQKVADYFKNKDFKDKTFFLADQGPVAWETKQEAFEGEGGLPRPSAVDLETLTNSDALYETPAAVLQYRLQLRTGGRQEFRFLFGPAANEGEIRDLRSKFLPPDKFSAAVGVYSARIADGEGCLKIQTPDQEFDHLVNQWLPRQVFYHGDANRLTTDPQTRNYLQDNMGMSYVKPAVARAAFLHALSQQEPSGAMPDGILLVEGAELKYINQVPHTDHCVWLPVCLQAYLDETNDYALLHEIVRDREGQTRSVMERVTSGVKWLMQARDERGLSYIAQGDWCDPMNMVGYKGKGVSGWLSLATAYATRLWADVCEQEGDLQSAKAFQMRLAELHGAIQKHLWDGRWFARGITDDGAAFGVSTDREGRIFLNCQSWAILAETTTPEQQALMLKAISEYLETPYGAMTLGPAFTGMREDVGRITQKFPGSAENGSVYNHDAAFYIFSMYSIGESDRAFRNLRQMIPGPDESDYLHRGQLPVFIPNYYRGAWREHPRTAGRSSQLFNTGTVAWIYRCVIENLFGLKGERKGLRVQPQLPRHWAKAEVTRRFRGATFHVRYQREPGLTELQATLDGHLLRERVIQGIEPGKRYQLDVQLPFIPAPC